MKFYLNYAEGITIEIVNATKDMELCVQNYFPGCISAYSINPANYTINYKGMTDVHINTSHFKLITPFKATDYLTKEHNGYNIAISTHETMGGKHLIFRKDKNIDVYSYDTDNKKLMMRLLREIIFEKLLKKGYFPLHASSVQTSDGKAIILFGKSGAGKTTCFLQNIFENNAGPISNDVSMVKKNDDGSISVIGLPFDITITNDIVKKYNLNPNEKFEKSRYSTKKFIELTNKKMILKSKVKQLFFIYYIDNENYEEKKLTKNTFNKLLSEIQDECNFHFGDFLGIRNDEKFESNLQYLLPISKYVTGNLNKYFCGVENEKIQR